MSTKGLLDRKWYAAQMTEKLGKFVQDEVVYVRRFRGDLAAGPVLILFQVKGWKSARVADSYGRVCKLIANHDPAPPGKNIEIELAYREYLKENPPAKRKKMKRVPLNPNRG